MSESNNEYEGIDAADGGDVYYQCCQCRANLVEAVGLICSECKTEERLNELYPPTEDH